MDLTLAASEYAADWGDPTVGLEHATVAILSRIDAHDAAERDLIQRVSTALAATRPMTAGTAAFGTRASPRGVGGPRSVTPELRAFLASEIGGSDREVARGLLRRLSVAGSPRADRAMAALTLRLEEPLQSGTTIVDVPFTTDLTSLAAEGRLDPVIGRDAELARVIRVFARHTKNHPVLIGSPGVGKTAIVESLAQRIVDRAVPDHLLDVRVHQLQMAELLAATRYRGDLEERLTGLLESLTRPAVRAILFIDEIHLIVGAGTSEGSPVDIGSLLKPILSRGHLRLVGATTALEYETHIQKDPALERRLQPILVTQPTMAQTMDILAGLVPTLERHHRVTIPTSTASSAALLSDRLAPGRYQPDKAIDLLDEACALTRSADQHGGVVTLGRLREIAALSTAEDQRSDTLRLPRPQGGSMALALDVITGLLADAVRDPSGQTRVVHVTVSGSVDQFIDSLAAEVRGLATIVLGYGRIQEPTVPEPEISAVVRVVAIGELLREPAGTLRQVLARAPTQDTLPEVVVLVAQAGSDMALVTNELRQDVMVELDVRIPDDSTDLMEAILTTVRWLDGRTAAVRMDDRTAAHIRTYLAERTDLAEVQDAVRSLQRQISREVCALVDSTRRDATKIVIEFDVATGQPRLRFDED